MQGTVIVYCTAEPHAGRRVTVGQFTRFGPGWRVAPFERPGEERGHVLIQGDRVVDASAPRDTVRSRYNLTCRLCGLSLVQREKELSGFLDKLVIGGVSDISLSALVARLA